VRQDDAIFRQTRWMNWVVVAVLVPALVVLWGLPGNTEDFWAWPIKADLSQIFMGAGYGAGAYFFTRAALGKRWHAVSAGVLSAAFFAAVMLVVTLIHWDKFNHGDAPFWAAFAFYAWVIIYIAAPVVVTAFWWWNRRTDPRRPEPGEPIVPPGVRLATRVISGAVGATALVLLLWPSIGVDHGPWSLTPLTTRVVAAFFSQVAFGALLLSLDERWSSWRLLLQTFLVATALVLVGVLREWGELETGRVSAWIFVGGLAALAVGILVLYRTMESRLG
jgi:peptidoglycan/LPS O-acetylase OafA/YrhL